MPTLINRSINLDQSKRFVDTIFLAQGEGGATTLNFTLMQSGAVIDLTGCTVNFLAKKQSGATLTNACTLTNAAQGKVAYVVTTQTAIEAGALTDARLEVLKSGVAWKSFKFPVTVEAVPDYTTAIQSTNEFTALQSLTSQITASTTAIGTLASLLTTAKTNLVAAINELFAFVPTTNIWYPTFAGSTTPGANQYSTRVGRWYKIGKLVHIEFSLTMSARDSAMAGVLKITDLPFAAAGNPAADIGICSGITMATTYNNQISGVVSGSSIVLYGLSDGSFDNVPCTGIVAGALIQGSADYMTA